MAERVYPQMDERMLRSADFEAASYVERAIKRRTETLEAQVRELQELVAKLEAAAQDQANQLRLTQEEVTWVEDRAARLSAERDAWYAEVQRLKYCKVQPHCFKEPAAFAGANAKNED